MKPPGRKHLAVRVALGFLRTVGWIVGGVLAVVLSVLLHLDTQSTRTLACGQLEPLLNELLAGDFEMRCVEISLDVIRVRDVVIRDHEGEVVIRAEELRAVPDLRALIGGEIAVSSAHIEAPWLTLESDSNDEMRIATVFIPVDQTPDPTPGPDLTIRIRNATIGNGTVVQVPGGFNFDRLDFAADVLVVGADTTVDASLGEGARALFGEDPVGAVERLTAHIEIFEDGESDFAAEIRFEGDDFITADMRMPWGAETLESLEFDVRLAASPELVAELGQPEIAGLLATDVRAEAVASMRFDPDVEGIASMEAQVDAHTNGGDIALTAQTQGEGYLVAARTERLVLPEVLVGIPGEVRAALEAELVPTDDGIRFDVTGEDLRYDAWRVARLTAVGRVGEDAIFLESFDLPELSEGGHLDLTGRVGFDGAMRLHLDADLPQLAREPNLQRLAPSLRAGVRAELDIEVNMADERIDAEGSVVARGFRFDAYSASYVDVRGSVRGALLTPTADVHVVARGVDTGALRIDHANLVVHGGPAPTAGHGRYRVSGAVDVEGEPSANLALTIGVTPDDYLFDGQLAVAGFLPTELNIELDRVRLTPGSALSARRLVVRAGDALQLEARGTYRFVGRSDAQIDLERADLAQLDSFLELGQGLQGVATANIAFSGTPASPNIDASGGIEGLTIREISFDEARFDIDLERAGSGSNLRAVVSVDGGEAGRLALDLNASLPGRNPLRAIPDARFEGRVVTQDFVLATLAPFLPEDAPAVDGRIDMELQVLGSLRQPERVELAVVARDLRAFDIEPLAIDARAVLRGDQLQTEILVDDADEARLVEVRADMTVSLYALMQGQPPKSLLQEPWNLRIDVPERRLSELPAPYAMDIPGEIEAHGRFEGGTRQTVLGGIRGELSGVFRYDADSDQTCARGRPRADLTMTLEDGRTQVVVDGVIADRRALRVQANAVTPVEAWVLDPPTSMPAVEVAMEVIEFDLNGVPMACRFAQGTATGRLHALDLFGATPSIDAHFAVADLEVQGSEPLDLVIELSADGQAVRGDVKMRDEGRVALSIQGDVPVHWGADHMIPALRDEAWEVDVVMNHAPVQPLLAAVPQVGQPRGHLDGRVRLVGVGEDFSLRGNVELQEIALTIRQPLMRLQEVQGRLELDDRGLHLREVGFSDRDGKVRINGDVALDGWTPTSADLQIKAEDMPVRAQGIIYAFVTSDIGLRADFTETLNDVRVDMTRTAVRLPADIGRSVQALEQHSDVIYEDQPRFDPDAAYEPEEAAADESELIPVRIRVRSEPFWVRREDFSISIRPRLDIVLDSSGARLEGPVEIRRGFISLLGKQFDFEEGEIRFSGGRQLDPRLDLRAVHELRSRETVEVAIGGTLLHPTLTFSTTVPGVEGEAQILELLVRGRGGSQGGTAQEQTASFLAGLTAGILSNMTRREIGAYVPVFGLEADGAGAGRVRVGFQADRLIPELLRGFVLGAYVEGFAGSAEGSDDNLQATGGVLVEFILPRSLVFTTSWEAGNNWSVELRWEP